MPLPEVTFYEFAVSGVSPSGERHASTHASYVKELNISASGALDFGHINIDNENDTPTKCILFRVKNLNGNTRVENMRFWLSAIPEKIQANSFNYVVQNHWEQNKIVAEGSGNVPTTLPEDQNLFRGAAAGYEENHPHMSGVDDHNVSQYVYFNVTCKPASYPGRFGAGGEGSFIYKVTYDYI